VRHCQLIVALWDGVNEQPTPDGSMAILPGGTADVVRMSEQGIKVNDDVLLTAPEKTPVEHLWTRRLKHAQRGNPIVKPELVASWASTRNQAADPYPVMQRWMISIVMRPLSLQINSSRRAKSGYYPGLSLNR